MSNPTTRKQLALDHEKTSREKENYVPDVLPSASEALFQKWDKLVRGSNWFVDKSKRS